MRGYGSLKIPTAEATSFEKEAHVFSTSKVFNEMMCMQVNLMQNNIRAPK